MSTRGNDPDYEREYTDEDHGIERCEAGCNPGTNPVTAHDPNGVPFCEACWNGLLDDESDPERTNE